MKKEFLVLTLLLSSFAIQAQETYTVKASVKDGEGQPLDFGNVLILAPLDSSMIKGEVFEQGELLVEGITENEFIVKIVALGYADYYSMQTTQESVMDLGEISMGQSQLDDVEIVASKPMFTRQGDKLIIDVESSDLSASGTALDALRRSPQIIVDGNDNVMIFGKGAAVIYVDGQRITSMEVLKNLSSDDVKEIEVIKNPSAKYDAEGSGGVINIITKKNDLEGFNGSVYQNLTKASYWRAFTSFQLAYKKGDFNVYGAIRNFSGAGTSNDQFFRTLGEEPSITTMVNDLEDVWRANYSPGYRLGADYYIGDYHRIGFQVKGYLSDNSYTTDNYNTITEPGNIITKLHTQTETSGINGNNSFNLNHLWNNDSTGNELFTAFEYALFDSETIGNINEDISENNNTKRSTGISDIAIITGKTDFTHYWEGIELTLEAGAKYFQTTNNSSVLFEQYSGGQWVSDSSITNGFEFNEGVGAAYFQFLGTVGKLDYRAGLRAEHTNTYGFSNTYNTEVIDTNYLNLFPSGYLGYNFTDDLQLGLTYASRINRPGYGDLDPFVDYIDSVSAMIGNPLLRPEYATSIEASLIYMQFASIDFSYSRTNDAMYAIVERDENNGVIAQTRNIDYDESYLLGINLPYEFPWWLTYNAFGYQWTTVQFKDQGEVTTIDKPFWYVYLYNEFRFPEDITLEITYEHYSSGISGIFHFNPIDQLSASISKRFFDDKLNIRFMANDILHSYKEEGNSTVDGFGLLYKSTYDSNTFMLAVSYNFGRLKRPDNSDRSVNQEEMDRISTD